MATDTKGKKPDQITGVNKGGRPKKSHHLDEKITVMCSRIDVITIRFYAKELNLTLSEYLRTLGLKRQVDRKIKVLPREALQLIGTLNHIAANINQIAHKRNRGDELNAIERATLMALCTELKELAKAVKTALK
jgi:hypothetical protein